MLLLLFPSFPPCSFSLPVFSPSFLHVLFPCFIPSLFSAFHTHSAISHDQDASPHALAGFGQVSEVQPNCFPHVLAELKDMTKIFPQGLARLKHLRPENMLHHARKHRDHREACHIVSIRPYASVRPSILPSIHLHESNHPSILPSRHPSIHTPTYPDLPIHHPSTKLLDYKPFE